MIDLFLGRWPTTNDENGFPTTTLPQAQLPTEDGLQNFLQRDELEPRGRCQGVPATYAGHIARGVTFGKQSSTCHH